MTRADSVDQPSRCLPEQTEIEIHGAGRVANHPVVGSVPSTTDTRCTPRQQNALLLLTAFVRRFRLHNCTL